MPIIPEPRVTNNLISRILFKFIALSFLVTSINSPLLGLSEGGQVVVGGELQDGLHGKKLGAGPRLNTPYSRWIQLTLQFTQCRTQLSLSAMLVRPQ